LLLVEIESEGSLIVDIGLLLNVQAGGSRSIKLLGNRSGRVEEVLKKCGLLDRLAIIAVDYQVIITYGDGKVIASSELGDFSNVPERSSHDDGLVTVLLVVVKDALNALNSRIFFGSKVLLHRSLVPVENTTDERRDQVSTGFSTGNGLDEREHERQIAVDAIF
jgi:hypothetical protein